MISSSRAVPGLFAFWKATGRTLHTATVVVAKTQAVSESFFPKTEESASMDNAQINKSDGSICKTSEEVWKKEVKLLIEKSLAETDKKLEKDFHKYIVDNDAFPIK